MHLADLTSYMHADGALCDLYARPDDWAGKVILNRRLWQVLKRRHDRGLCPGDLAREAVAGVLADAGELLAIGENEAAKLSPRSRVDRGRSSPAPIRVFHWVHPTNYFCWISEAQVFFTIATTLSGMGM